MDVVITYVDNCDENWVKTIRQFTDIPKDYDRRYRSWNNLKYCLRSIATNMSFVRKIFLVVSELSQVPKWINKNEINIVYHKDIIPEKYLPTFNSRTIEMHLHNIKDLGEEFVYFNDDMFIINKSRYTDFFVNGKPCNILQAYTEEEFKNKITSNPVYLNPYKRCTDEAANLLNITSKYYYFSNHGPNPLLKSVCKKVYNLLGDKLLNTFTPFRDEKNFVHFIYSIYQLLGGYTTDKVLKNKYIKYCNNLVSFHKDIRLIKETCLCVNDFKSDKISIERMMFLFNEVMDMHFPNLSKFEMKPKVSLCTIVKNENKYLKEYVEHYLKLGFNKLYLYDNNDIHGETPMDVISEYIENGFVVYHDFRGKKVCQLEAYNDCYKRYSGENDWIAFFDADEFLELTRHDNISSFVAQDIYKDFDGVKINWLCYGDNGQLKYEDKPVQERFTKPVIRENNYYLGVNINYYIKTIVKCKNSNVFWNDSVHIPSGVVCCNSLGIASPPTMYNKPFYNDIVLKHYITKSTEEYLEKIKRGYPDQVLSKNKIIGLLNKYFTINDKTQENMNLINEEIKNVEIFF